MEPWTEIISTGSGVRVLCAMFYSQMTGPINFAGDAYNFCRTNWWTCYKMYFYLQYYKRTFSTTDMLPTLAPEWKRISVIATLVVGSVVIVHVILHPDLQTPDFYIFTFGRS
jgi:hypothetical protein